MSAFSWGGSEELWYQTALLALAEGHMVMVSVVKHNEEDRHLTTLRQAGAQLQRREQMQPPTLLQRGLKKIFTKTPDKGLAGAINNVKSFNPDVVCLSQGSTFDVVQGWYFLFIETLNTPYFIVCQHNYESGQLLSAKARLWAQTIFKKARKVLFVSERNGKVAERMLVCELTNMALIQNPVNLMQPEVLPFPAENKKFKMACIARLDCVYKGQDILLQALGGNAWRERHYQLDLYGEGPDDQYLAELIKFYGLSEKVFLRGHHNDIKKIWADHHLLLLPSLSEGTSLAMTEAMLCGRCVLTTDVGDSGKYIITGQTGFLAACASVSQITLSLEQAWSQKEKLNEYGRNAYQHITALRSPSPPADLLKILTN